MGDIFDRPIHLSVIGIGVDLSVATVERISAIPGAKYVTHPVTHASMVARHLSRHSREDIRTPSALIIQGFIAKWT